MNKGVIEKIRQKIREESILKGRTETQKQHKAEDQQQRNKVCKQAEDEVDKEFDAKEKTAGIGYEERTLFVSSGKVMFPWVTKLFACIFFVNT